VPRVMSPSRTIVSCFIAILLTGAALVCSPLALALFTKSTPGGPLTVASSTLTAPTNLTAVQATCRVNKSIEINLTWTATSSSYATSYTVERSTGGSSSYTAIGTVSTSKTSYTDSESSLNPSTTYYYRVSTVYHAWIAASSAASLKTSSKSC
jgi:hypothetical protein